MENGIITINRKLIINYIASKNISDQMQVVIHLNGINFSNSLNRFWKMPIDELPPIIFLNLPGNDPKIKPYRTNKNYIKLIKKCILNLKQKFQNIKNFYLTGESWGANLALLYAKKYPTSIAGIICWNAPSKMNTRLSAKSNAQNLKIGMVHLLSILFNTNSRCLTGDMKSITDNEILLRISNKPGYEKQGFVNLDLAAWYAMRPSFKYLKKHFKTNNKLPITYIQTKQDCYYELNIKKINKFISYANNVNKIIIQDKGMHLLSLDTNGNDKIIWDQMKLMTGVN